jgi:hypothetical protein
MNILKNLFLFLILFIFSASLSFSGGNSFKKNSSNGFTNNGLNLECKNANIFITDEEFNENIITSGEVFTIKFEGISAFTSKSEKVFSGRKPKRTNSEGEEKVIKYDHFYAESAGFPDQSRLILRTDLVLNQVIYSGNQWKDSTGDNFD